MPDAMRLFDAVRHLGPIILSGLPRGNWAAPQKVRWAGERFPGTRILTVMAVDKRNHARQGDILVDDQLKFTSIRADVPRIFWEKVMDRLFTTIAGRSAHAIGQPSAFILSSVFILVWAVSGPFFHYSDTWQLIVNTATTVLTFLAVFLIQNSQNRDGAAIQAKLDEILRALENAREDFVGIEHLTDAQISAIRDALEQDIKSARGRARTTRPTVERLLKRY